MITHNELYRGGTYFKIELFGGPTTLPWGLQVPDSVAAAQPERFGPGLTHHPTFLYECLWNLALVGFLIWLDHKRVLRPGRIFALYIGGSFGAGCGSRVCGIRIFIYPMGYV